MLLLWSLTHMNFHPPLQPPQLKPLDRQQSKALPSGFCQRTLALPSSSADLDPAPPVVTGHLPWGAPSQQRGPASCRGSSVMSSALWPFPALLATIFNSLFKVFCLFLNLTLFSLVLRLYYIHSFTSFCVFPQILSSSILHLPRILEVCPHWAFVYKPLVGSRQAAILCAQQDSHPDQWGQSAVAQPPVFMPFGPYSFLSLVTWKIYIQYSSPKGCTLQEPPHLGTWSGRCTGGRQHSRLPTRLGQPLNHTPATI